MNFSINKVNAPAANIAKIDHQPKPNKREKIKVNHCERQKLQLNGFPICFPFSIRILSS